jgi:hypothetical protein
MAFILHASTRRRGPERHGVDPKYRSLKKEKTFGGESFWTDITAQPCLFTNRRLRNTDLGYTVLNSRMIDESQTGKYLPATDLDLTEMLCRRLQGALRITTKNLAASLPT